MCLIDPYYIYWTLQHGAKSRKLRTDEHYNIGNLLPRHTMPYRVSARGLVSIHWFNILTCALAIHMPAMVLEVLQPAVYVERPPITLHRKDQLGTTLVYYLQLAEYLLTSPCRRQTVACSLMGRMVCRTRTLMCLWTGLAGRSVMTVATAEPDGMVEVFFFCNLFFGLVQWPTCLRLVISPPLILNDW